MLVALLVVIATACAVFVLVKNKQSDKIIETKVTGSTYHETISETSTEGLTIKATATETATETPDIISTSDSSPAGSYGKSYDIKETVYKSRIMSVKIAEQRFNEFIGLYDRWLSIVSVSERYQKEENKINLKSGAYGYPVTDSGITSFNDIRNKFLCYCTESVFESIPYDCPYEEYNGRLYYAVEGRSFHSFDFVAEDVKKSNLNKYIISTLFIAQELGEPELYDCTWTYERIDDGRWLLTGFKKQYEWSYDFDTDLQGLVNTSGSVLNIREYPSVNAEIVGQAKNGSCLSVKWVAEEWAMVSYIDNEDYIFGWVKTEYLK